jgi:crotonobetainyl-CoA:carnitine CoA-transferase CaiB-like acyl-CoA transferase
MTLPPTGIKVLDFSEHGFVPSAAAALGDFGADVVKLERPTGDAMRSIIASGMVATVDGQDFLFELYNRNKRGVSVDVEVPAGREVFERLVKWADVYITNQLPRVRRKLRTEPADLFALKPGLVYAKGHGQGQRGDDAEAGGFDAVSFWSRGGVAHVLTDPDATRPAQQRPALGDVPTGMFLAGAVCAALVHAQRTGKGIVVDTSLLNGAAWTIGPDLAYSSLSGEILPTDTGPRSPLTQHYKTADGRFVMLMMIDEARYWTQASRALGLEELFGRYPDPPSRLAARTALAAEVSAVIGGLTREETDRRLRAEGCIFSFMATPPEVLHDAAVVDNGYLMAQPGRPTKLAAAPAQFDDELPSVRRVSPGIGENSREILAELGYGADEITALIDAGTVIAP